MLQSGSSPRRDRIPFSHRPTRRPSPTSSSAPGRTALREAAPPPQTRPNRRRLRPLRPRRPHPGPPPLRAPRPRSCSLRRDSWTPPGRQRDAHTIHFQRGRRALDDASARANDVSPSRESSTTAPAPPQRRAIALVRRSTRPRNSSASRVQPPADRDPPVARSPPPPPHAPSRPSQS